MHMQNLNNDQIIIRHNTIIDEDDLFSTIYLQQINPFLSPENYIVPDNDENLLFDQFIKTALNNSTIGIQLFEIVNKNISFTDYFFDDSYFFSSDERVKMIEKFNLNHQILLYFFIPNKSIDNFGNLLTHSFSASSYKNHDFFLLNKDEFFVDLDIESSQFRLEIFPNVILKYLKKSQDLPIKSFYQSFQHFYLNSSLPQSEHVSQKRKI